MFLKGMIPRAAAPVLGLLLGQGCRLSAILTVKNTRKTNTLVNNQNQARVQVHVDRYEIHHSDNSGGNLMQGEEIEILNISDTVDNAAKVSAYFRNHLAWKPVHHTKFEQGLRMLDSLQNEALENRS